jgi:hypothetical protein
LLAITGSRPSGAGNGDFNGAVRSAEAGGAQARPGWGNCVSRAIEKSSGLV